MSKSTSIETTIPLSGTKNGVISVSKIVDPYGKGSGTVASIGIALDGDATNPEWKVHIPLENIEAVLDALEQLK